jgi:integrase
VLASPQTDSPKKRLATVYVFPAPLPKPALAPFPFRLTPPEPPVPRKPRRRRKPPVSLSDEQLLALLAKAEEHRHRDAIMIAVTYWHGLRASEAVNLKASDIENGQIRVQRGKGSDATLQDLQEHENPLLNERALMEEWMASRGRYGVKGGKKPSAQKFAPAKMQQSTQIVTFLAEPTVSSRKYPVETPAEMPGPATHYNPDGSDLVKPAGGSEPLPASPDAHLAPFPPRRTPSQRLFPIGRVQFWRLVHGYALAAGIPRRKCKTHMLKHTIAKHLVRAGHPLNEIQEWMGWSSLETMNWYTRADEEELGNRIGDRIRAKQGLRPVRQGSLFP